MTELETIAIYSPKDGVSKWIINKEDYDPQAHKLWGDGKVAQVSKPAVESIAAPPPVSEPAVDFEELSIHAQKEQVEAEGEQAEVQEAEDVNPDDFVYENSDIVGVVIVDPANRRAKKEISVSEYNPDTHTLWSQRKGAKG